MGTTGPVGYAVVGLGAFAEHRVLPGFRHSRKAKLVALVSGDERKARRLASRFGPADVYDYNTCSVCWRWAAKRKAAASRPHSNALRACPNPDLPRRGGRDCPPEVE